MSCYEKRPILIAQVTEQLQKLTGPYYDNYF